MRIYLYILAGIVSSLIGWNLGQFFLTDLGLLKQMPELVLFPCISASLAIGMVFNEIFISSPTRPKQNFRTAKVPVLIAAGLGILAGLIAGGIAQVLFLPQIRTPAFAVRIVAWLFIGSAIGFAEGFTWRWRSIEAGDVKRYLHRLRISVIGGTVASLLAALLFELLRGLFGKLPSGLTGIEDPFGFSLLGALLGLAFSLTNSPSFVMALRAGAGFEYSSIDVYGSGVSQATISKPLLNFVSDGDATEIEEGLSIQLPQKGKITIGSSSKANICIAGLPTIIASIELGSRSATLIPHSLHFNRVARNGSRLSTSKSVPLKHNDLLAFYTQDSDKPYQKEFFRFVYYNRFLDPQA
jgi:hypothetical protein